MQLRQERLAGLTVRILGGDDGRGGGDGPTLVLLHGFGAPGTDLVPLGDAIELPPGTRLVFPEAPIELALELGTGDGRAWWPIDLMRLHDALVLGRMRELRHEVPPGLHEANAQVNAMLGELEAALGVDRRRLILGGFSQGAMLACDVALRSSEPLAGLVLMSPGYIAEDEWNPLMVARRGLPVYMSHGRADPLLPFALAESLRDALSAAGLDVTWVPFDEGHGVPRGVLDPLAGFLRRSLV
jgi:phospholipase/carboxylesterase